MNAFYSALKHVHPGHFHTEKGYGVVRENGTNDWLFIYTVDGRGAIDYAGNSVSVNPGDIVLWLPGVRHDYRIASGCAHWEMYWAHFFPWPHWQELLHWPEWSGKIRRLHIGAASRARLAKTFEAMCLHYAGSHLRSQLHIMHSLEEALFICDEYNPNSRQYHLDSRIKKALDYLCSHLSSAVSLDEVARDCGLSKSRLSHLFGDQVGATPMEYLESRRMELARQLLSDTSFSVSEIADMTGFDSPYYFTRRFTRHAGSSPRKYRAAGNQTALGVPRSRSGA